MRLLVTGGAGFIGSHFIDYELEQYPEDEVLCLDALTYAGKMENLETALKNPRFHFVRGNICDSQAVEQVFRRFAPDVVINFAAESHVDRSVEGPDLFLRTNVGTGVLLDACRKHPVRRFHQISTDEVYGDLPLGRPDLSFTEESPLRPSSPYSASKASADLLVLSYGRTYHLPVSISRCSNNYGPRQHPEKLIPKIIAYALKNQSAPVYGSGLQSREWIAVKDHCTAVDRIIRGGMCGAIYNVGTDCELSNGEMVQTILRIMNRPASMFHFVNARPEDDLRYSVDASKLRKQLGWKPETDFDRGIGETIAWYMENQQWLNLFE